ncbi:hypothetical protein B9Z55_008567 [Caenorhabditis nigoni]|uniref:Protein-tyrosine-phosphatase n=1 Tax=Caenorhabditis nigoni TaxID=1611254 RepID=A0A2G5UN69_9PELO|nr:hypothetical protein B9Z55_008567 [Caenorhabditis nigoni]
MPNLDELLSIKRRLKATEITTTLPSGEVKIEKRADDGTYEEVKNPESFESEPNVSNRRKKKVEYLQRRGFIVDLEPDLVVGVATEDVLFGSQDVAADILILRNQKITNIINVGTGIPNHFPGNFEYLKIDILDLPETKIVDYFDEVFDYIKKVHEKRGKCFIHCNAGISRSASFAVGYLMKSQQMTYRQAFEKCRETRSIRPNSGFEKQLREYELKLS